DRVAADVADDAGEGLGPPAADRSAGAPARHCAGCGAGRTQPNGKPRCMNPIFVALDTRDVHRAAAIARDVSGIAGGMKLGLEFFLANGPEGVLRIAEHRMPIFLDLKLHDIPNTVARAVESIAPLSPAILTVHAAGGREMMAAAKA